ncbi:MAG: AAA family ATPase [Lachnospiraceae bacterium]|jgi:hypothetical protein|nr:AAA family ATPase [Lachnospiraceae bacterium]
MDQIILDEMIKKIKMLVMLNKDQVPKGSLLWNKKPIKDVDDLMDFLVELFNKEEDEIRKEHEKKFVTDDYEDGVRSFATMLMRHLLPFHNQLKDRESYKALCRKRHIGYGYYNLINNEHFEGEEISDGSSQKLLYLSLVEFYDNFYGSFYDNEQAIELLCKFYPKKLKLQKHVQKIVSALYTHISTAGTPNDMGYAFQGIRKIEMNIRNLPEYIVYPLLDRYSLYNLINQKICRHQIFAIIDHVDFTKDLKTTLKFWYLDSLVIADIMGDFLLEKVKEDEGEIETHNNYYDYRLSDEEYIITVKPSTYWKNFVSTRERKLLWEDKVVAVIRLQDDQIRVYKKNTEEYESFPFIYKDWLMEGFEDSEIKEKLRSLVFAAGTHRTMPYGSMTFSLAYLDHYRGLQDQVIDFNHQFIYDSEEKRLKRNTETSDRIPHLYGKSVSSLSCIVGKNAKGKTSIIDFLRETFFKILKFIQEQRLSCENGYIEEREYEDYGILDKNARFLMVFSLAESSYFVTNIKGIDWENSEAEPFHRGAYRAVNELSKVAYFSNQLRGDQADLLLDEQREVVYDKEIREKRNISNINNDFRQADYSEKEIFIEKRKGIRQAQEKLRDENTAENPAEDTERSKGIINRDICYQLTFLEKSGAKKICSYIDVKEEKIFRLVSRVYGEKKKEFFLKDLENQKEPVNEKLQIIKDLEEFALFPDTSLKYLSAGQYAKLSFLARLHWFLEGDLKEIERYNDLAQEQVFSRGDVLLDNETGLIFIDEGEIYYHPEWQRRYVKLLLELVNGQDKKVQIVITTNSPFMISDILSEDITYLSDDEAKEKDRERKAECTLGQNIHKLLRDNFFMKYTIGEYARDIIENLIFCLQEDSKPAENNEGKTERSDESAQKKNSMTAKEKDDQRKRDMDEKMRIYFDEVKMDYNTFRLLIDRIGEPVYRESLRKMLDLSPFAKEDKAIKRQIEELEAAQRELQDKISKLKETKGEDEN